MYVVGRFKYNQADPRVGYDHTLDNTPDPIPNSEVKLQWARLVLGWGTTRESRGVVSVFLFLSLSRAFLHGRFERKEEEKNRGGDGGIEPPTSCTRSRNHTSRPITPRMGLFAWKIPFYTLGVCT